LARKQEGKKTRRHVYILICGGLEKSALQVLPGFVGFRRQHWWRCSRQNLLAGKSVGKLIFITKGRVLLTKTQNRVPLYMLDETN